MLGLMSKKKTMSGGEAIARMLKIEGVEKVFGIIDGTYFGLYSNLGPQGIELITPRHESNAAHMAGAYALMSGKIGVCMASNGPGVANLLPGIAVENAEGNRVLAITSARRTGTISPERLGTFQSFPQGEVIKAMAKWSCQIPSFERLPEIMRRAFRAVISGRPGVVHIDVPEDIMNGSFAASDALFVAPEHYRRTEPLAASWSQVERAADMLVQAELPLIHAGAGVLHALAWTELDQVARLLKANVTTSWAGRAAVSETNDYAVPLIHLDLTQKIHNRADVVLTLGSRMGETDWWGKAPYWARSAKQQMIQVDLEEEILGVNKPIELGILACAKVFLRMLHQALLERTEGIDETRRSRQIRAIAKERAKDRTRLDKKLEDRSSPMLSAHITSICRDRFPDDSVVVLDGGNTAIWGHFFHEIRTPNTLVYTSKFGMLGAGISQALGAKAACPDREVYCLIGDGAMGFHPQEIETAVRNRLKVIYLVFCDRQWGMVKMNQQFNLKPLKTLIKGSLSPEETINADFNEIEFDKLARTMGGYGERVADPDSLAQAIDRCRQQELPAVIHVDVDPVKHMWAPGLRHFKDMHAEPKG